MGGACGDLLEIFVLGRSRWGRRSLMLKNVLAHEQSCDSDGVLRRVACKCEVLAGEVITVVLACSGASAGNEKVGDKGIDAIGEKTSVPTPIRRLGGAQSPGASEDSAAVQPPPSFELHISVSSPLERAPQLLQQRPIRVDSAPVALSPTHGRATPGKADARLACSLHTARTFPDA